MTAPTSPPTLPLDELVRDAAGIRALALRLTGSRHAADDVVQDLAVRALRHQGEPVRRPGAWLRTVLRNLVRDRGRAEARRRAREDSVTPRPPQPAPDDVVARAEIARRLMAAVLELREPYRRTVLRRYLDGVSAAQIAREDGVTPEGVRVRLHRAVVQLRAELSDESTGPLSAWLLPLCRPSGPSGTAAGSTLSKGVVMAAGTKKTLTWLVAALLLALLVGGGWSWFVAPANPVSAQRERQTERARVRERPRAAQQAAPAPGDPSAGTAPAESAAAPPAAVPVRVLTARLVEVREREPPFRRPLPVLPEEERDRVDAGEGGGGLTVDPGLSALSRWDVIPPFGDVTLSGRVIDADGRPVPGASLLRLPLGADGRPRRVGGYTFFQPVGKAAEDGTFTLSDQSPGHYALTADHATTMRDEGDLDTSPAVRIAALPGGDVADLVIRLPIRVASLGRIAIRVVDDAGDPVAGDTVEVIDHGSAYTDEAGRWTFDGVTPGAYEVRTRPYGYTRGTASVTVAPGRTASATLTVRRELTGAEVVSGRVVDRDGNGVAGAIVYLGNGSGISYRATTAADGAYRFEELPAVLAREAFSVTVHPDPSRKDHTSARRGGLLVPVDDVELVVDRRRPVEVHVFDPDDGEQLAPHALSATRTVVTDARARPERLDGGTLRRPGAPLVLALPVGLARLTVSAPGRRTRVFEVDVPASDAPLRVEIGLGLQ